MSSMYMSMNIPRIGVGVIVVYQNRVLLGKRKNAHGEGDWSFPGGHLEFQESFEACAQREVLEEAGIQIHNIRIAAVTNDIFTLENKHYVTIFMKADLLSGTPHVLEPHKCEQWEWFLWSELPRPLFLPIQNLLEQGYSFK